MTLFGRDSLITVVDGAARRPRPGPRHPADAGPLPGPGGRPAQRGGARSHPARDALRRGVVALARRRHHLLRHGRRHPAVRDAARRAAPVGPGPRGGRRAAAPRRPGHRLDRELRRPRRRRLRRVPAHVGPGPAQPGLEGLLRRRSASPTAGSPTPPIALCEVQGYVYGAYLARAYFAGEQGDVARSAGLRRPGRRAEGRLQPGLLAGGQGLARHGPRRDKRPIDALTSNMGHCLWTGILDDDKADARGRAGCCRPDLFSGWGVRTLATSMVGYNPISYHCGSVWPHDNAIVAAGLMRYGYRREAQRVIMAILDAAVAAGRPAAGAVQRAGAHGAARWWCRYPTSCSPQAWAAASPLLMLRTLLRLDPWVPRGQGLAAARPARADRAPAGGPHPARRRPGVGRGRRRQGGGRRPAAPTSSSSTPRGTRSPAASTRWPAGPRTSETRAVSDRGGPLSRSGTGRGAARSARSRRRTPSGKRRKANCRSRSPASMARYRASAWLAGPARHSSQCPMRRLYSASGPPMSSPSVSRPEVPRPRPGRDVAVPRGVGGRSSVWRGPRRRGAGHAGPAVRPMAGQSPARAATSPGRSTPGGGAARCRSWCRRRGPAAPACRPAGRRRGGPRSSG